jgi:Flp pilus assembly protein TadD
MPIKTNKDNYLKAETLLKEALTLYIEDKDALLNLANLYLISNELDKAEVTYNRLAENPAHEINALNGLALVSHLNGKEKDALIISQSAYNRFNEITDESLVQQTTERYIQALIWNKKYKQVETLTGAIVTIKRYVLQVVRETD